MTRLTLTFALLFVSLSALAQSADLRVDLSDLGQPRLLFTLLNQGPDVARNVQLEAEIPPPLTVGQIFADRTECAVTGTLLRCNLGDVLVYPGDVRPFDIILTAPEVDASYTVTARITSDTPDPNAANHVLIQNFTTLVHADLSVVITPNRARVDPGSVHVFDVDVANYYNVRSPRDLRVLFESTGGTIEHLQADPMWTCTVSGTTAECRTDVLNEDCWCGRDMNVFVRANPDRGGAETMLRASVTSNMPERWDGNNAAEAALQTYRHLVVSTTADAGAGSLRAAIEEANRSCTPGPCKIVFELPAPAPAEGWFTITPAEPLPPITADRVYVDGEWQTSFGGNTNPNGPEVAIDGRLAHVGLEIHSACEAVVRGLALGHFEANQGLWLSQSRPCGDPLDRRELAANFLGVAPDGTTPWPNLRGLRLDGAGFARVTGNTIAHNRRSGVWMWHGQSVNLDRNRIERNGASGIFLGPEVRGAGIFVNTIRGHPEMGLAVARGAAPIEMRQNAMRANGGLGIDWGLDGMSPANGDDSAPGAPSNAPTLLNARYDPATDRTIAEFSLNSAPLGLYGNGWMLDLYANDGPDGDGEQWLVVTTTFPLEEGPKLISVRGNLTGKWLNATSTRIQYYASRPGEPSTNLSGSSQSSTSELSNTVRVE